MQLPEIIKYSQAIKLLVSILAPLTDVTNECCDILLVHLHCLFSESAEECNLVDNLEKWLRSIHRRTFPLDDGIEIQFPSAILNSTIENIFLSRSIVERWPMSTLYPIIKLLLTKGELDMFMNLETSCNCESASFSLLEFLCLTAADDLNDLILQELRKSTEKTGGIFRKSELKIVCMSLNICILVHRSEIMRQIVLFVQQNYLKKDCFYISPIPLFRFMQRYRLFDYNKLVLQYSTKLCLHKKMDSIFEKWYIDEILLQERTTNDSGVLPISPIEVSCLSHNFSAIRALMNLHFPAKCASEKVFLSSEGFSPC